MLRSNSSVRNGLPSGEHADLNQVRGLWRSAEDAALAQNMQQDEFSKKADRNKVERKTARQDVPLAKNTHKEEEAIAQQERLQHLNRQRELAERDASLARKTQSHEVQQQSAINKQRSEDDATVAWRQQQMELLRITEQRRRSEHVDLEVARRLQEEENKNAQLQAYTAAELEKKRQRERQDEEMARAMQDKLNARHQRRMAAANDPNLRAQVEQVSRRSQGTRSQNKDSKARRSWAGREDTTRENRLNEFLDDVGVAYTGHPPLAISGTAGNSMNIANNIAAGFPPTGASDSPALQTPERSVAHIVTGPSTTQSPPLFIQSEQNLHLSQSRANPVPDNVHIARVRGGGSSQIRVVQHEGSSPRDQQRRQQRQDSSPRPLSAQQQPSSAPRSGAIPMGVSAIDANVAYRQTLAPTEAMTVVSPAKIPQESGSALAQMLPVVQALPQQQMTSNQRASGHISQRQQYEMQLRQFKDHEGRKADPQRRPADASTSSNQQQNVKPAESIDTRAHEDRTTVDLGIPRSTNNEQQKSAGGGQGQGGAVGAVDGKPPAVRRYQNCVQIMRGDTAAESVSGSPQSQGQGSAGQNSASASSKSPSQQLHQSVSSDVASTPTTANQQQGQYQSTMQRRDGSSRTRGDASSNRPTVRDIYAPAPGNVPLYYQSQPLPQQQQDSPGHTSHFVQQPYAQNRQKPVDGQAVTAQLERQQYIRQHHRPADVNQPPSVVSPQVGPYQQQHNQQQPQQQANGQSPLNQQAYTGSSGGEQQQPQQNTWQRHRRQKSVPELGGRHRQRQETSSPADVDLQWQMSPLHDGHTPARQQVYQQPMGSTRSPGSDMQSLTVLVQGDRRSVAMGDGGGVAAPGRGASLAMAGRPLPQQPDERSSRATAVDTDTQQRRRSKSSQPRPVSMVERTPGEVDELADGFGHRGRDRSSLRSPTHHKNVIAAIDPTYNKQQTPTQLLNISADSAVAAENQHHYADVNELKQSHFAVVQGQKRTPPVNGGSSGKQNKAGRGCRQQ